ncbi:MAG: two pore domain potassium channel family protein [Gammaproteobacteria bacterium]|nr:two pore domain potassium channel family protein [Gammaproteobacteria bacterium]
MNKFQSRVTSLVLWLAKFKLFEKLFLWMAADKKNEHKFLLYFNVFNTSLYFTALISPWIFIIWGVIIPALIFRSSPLAAASNLIELVRAKTINFTGFLITVFFNMLFYICLFACFFMLFGSLENSNGKEVGGLWDHFYFSAVTFTTLGYGNIVPSNTVGEVIATIEVIIGFAAFALLIGIASALALDKEQCKSE